MKKIFSIGTFGNVVEIEKDNTVEHNDMIATAFQDFFQNLSEEERKDDGAILFYWSNGGVVCKYLKNMLFLESYDEGENLDFILCIAPETITESQLKTFENQYFMRESTFGLCHLKGEKFAISTAKFDYQGLDAQLQTYCLNRIEEETHGKSR